MRAAVLHQAGTPLRIEEVEVDSPGEGEVLVRTAAVGVCHSDLHFVDGIFDCSTPAVLGHEAAGVVEAVGPGVRYVEPGDHVISCLSVFCGECEYCLTGRMSICVASPAARPDSARPRLTRDGRPVAQLLNVAAFAQKLLVHEHAVVKVRRDIPLSAAALLGCAVTTGLGAVFNTARVRPGSSVAVVGCGGVGLNAVQGAILAGARQVVAVDTNVDKLELARRFGATDVVDAAEEDPVETILAMGGVDFSFEAIGLPLTCEQAFRMLRKGGTATVIGLLPPGSLIALPGPDLLQEKRIQGCDMGSNRFRVDMPHYVDLYLQGRLLLDELVSNRVALDDVNDALDALRRGSVTRTVIEFNL